MNFVGTVQNLRFAEGLLAHAEVQQKKEDALAADLVVFVVFSVLALGIGLFLKRQDEIFAQRATSTGSSTTEKVTYIGMSALQVGLVCAISGVGAHVATIIG